MASTYPSSVTTFTDKKDGTDAIMAAHVNNLQSEVVALQKAVGTFNQSVSGTLVAQLGTVSASVAALSAQKLAVSGGTAVGLHAQPGTTEPAITVLRGTSPLVKIGSVGNGYAIRSEDGIDLYSTSKAPLNITVHSTSTAMYVWGSDLTGDPAARLTGSGWLTLRGGLDGRATKADKLTTPRTIALSGGVTGSADFDGSGNVTITAKVTDDSHFHTPITTKDTIAFGTKATSGNSPTIPVSFSTSTVVRDVTFAPLKYPVVVNVAGVGELRGDGAVGDSLSLKIIVNTLVVATAHNDPNESTEYQQVVAVGTSAVIPANREINVQYVVAPRKAGSNGMLARYNDTLDVLLIPVEQTTTTSKNVAIP